ncbi:filamentous hemagglutinin N-terminal domain-containing protein [Morganella psychrotolerans]|uniref:two-partner secretion domain-containing protein n=1 Tax=Morganella psychrotolerans TaxID=368603 RepID=UPI0012E8517A|nr:filamentous hemagglutinin N-terminal domain-containing protein [Morganella psychrotolerans]
MLAVIILSITSASYATGSEYTYKNGMKIKINNNHAELSTKNKIPTINVNEKDNSGSAHIKYDEFNVGKKGLLFDNKINANIIINEVVSDSLTRLSGNITVRGQQAELLIVNPNGITCSSCSFTNTSHTHLIAGKAGKYDDLTDPEISEYESKGKKNIHQKHETKLSRRIIINLA